MSMIVWILLRLGLGLIASKIVATTGEGTVADGLIGIVGAIIGGWLFNLFGVNGVTGLNVDSIYSGAAAAIGAVTLLVVYHVFFRPATTPSPPSRPRNIWA